jgi:endonuclease/exonuclease/phosphatase family metal-dependent hydrolase
MEKETSQVVFWNIWGHRHADGIHDYLNQHSQDTDVFCLTEVTDVDAKQLELLGTNLRHGKDFGEQAQQVDGHQQLRQRFQDSHELHYISATRDTWKCDQNGTKFKNAGFGSMMIVSDRIEVIDHGHELLEFDGNIKSRVLQWLVYEKAGTCYLLAHLHGVWIKGNTKGDHEARTKQSHLLRMAMLRIMHQYEVDKVIYGGDFNLDIATEALRLLEGDHWRNLIKEFDVTSTRTVAYRNFGVAGESMYADYVLVSQNIEVESFKVDSEVLASDHAPLIVRFS